MLVEFSLANFRSFNKLQTLSFKATNLVSEDECVDEKNIITKGKNRLLKIIGIYGANASGKSNLLRGFTFLIEMVSNSIIFEDLPLFEYSSYRQSVEISNGFGFFQIVLLLDNKRLRFGFTLDKNSEIEKEWLFGPAGKNETFYYKRDRQHITINEEWFKEGILLPYEKNLRKGALFLTFCASYDGSVSQLIRDFLKEQTISEGLPGSVSRNNAGMTDDMVVDGKKEVVLNWMKEAGLLFTDIVINRTDGGYSKPRNQVVLFKNIYNTDGKSTGITVPMNLDRDESRGTKKFYSYIGGLFPIFENGGVFVVDEIDSNFHPYLLQKLISLFQNPNINKAGAQLLFTSHDTNLMNPDKMRRDQFYFTEKTPQDDTQLYSLADLKGIRNNADFARQYLAGFYGALPQLGNYLEQEAIHQNH